VSGISGKVCAVTGAGSGIGRALAQVLADRGARLALSDVDEAGLAETAALLPAGTEVHTTRLDVSDREAVLAYAEAVAAHFGVVHQVYNNAGVAHSRTTLESDWSEYERVLGINLWGVLHGTKAFLPHLVASGDGQVVNISSLNGILAQPGMTHYCTSKFAVRGFTESLDLELRRDRVPVRALSVHPGGIATAISRNALKSAREQGLPVTEEDEARNRLYEKQLLKMDPRAAAEVIVKAVEAGKPRVMVGNDAKLLDLLTRLVPSRVGGLVLQAERRMLKRR
jgi:NAD(P)-dependent dehydrogenase (short-subunit alcohol dehydrogenase family)